MALQRDGTHAEPRMYDDTNREICRAIQVEKRDRDQRRRVPTLLSAIDQLLTKLEELKLLGMDEAPAAERARAGELIADAQGVAPELVSVPGRIEDVAGLLLETQEPLLRESVRLRAKLRLAKRLGPQPGRAA